MKLSISNIAWTADKDQVIYEFMNQYGYSGLEIAPTRIFLQHPYDKLDEAGTWSKDIKKQYGFCISSMQSIWHGCQENMFGSKQERMALMDYTRKAIDFAAYVGCRNLVFGCPQNRNLPDGALPESAVSFFHELGEYAWAKHTVISMEANPPIYHTNYINDTPAALELVKQVDSRGFLLNLDVGTMVCNEEKAALLIGNVHLIHHVHISEPYLKPIKIRSLHTELKQLLEEEKYCGYLSIEMGCMDDLSVIQKALYDVKEVFH